MGGLTVKQTAICAGVLWVTSIGAGLLLVGFILWNRRKKNDRNNDEAEAEA